MKDRKSEGPADKTREPAKIAAAKVASSLKGVMSRLGKKTPPEPERPRQVPGKLRYTDLDLDEPGDAFNALRRASRTPPHMRHLEPKNED
ncbi:MAG TPA: hypothetical protein VIC25_09620 [Caulobacteraceae bacterium]|jgi:hypothetical protein